MKNKQSIVNKPFNLEFYSLKNPKSFSEKLEDAYHDIMDRSPLYQDCETGKMRFFEHKGCYIAFAEKHTYRRAHTGYNRWAAYALFKPYGYNFSTKGLSPLNIGRRDGVDHHINGLSEKFLVSITKEEFIKSVGLTVDCEVDKIFYEWK